MSLNQKGSHHLHIHGTLKVGISHSLHCSACQPESPKKGSYMRTEVISTTEGKRASQQRGIPLNNA